MNKAQRECIHNWTRKSIVKDTLVDLSYISDDHKYMVVQQFFQEYRAIDPTPDITWQIRNFGGGNHPLGLELSSFDNRKEAEQSQLDFIHDITSGGTEYTLISFDESGVKYKSNSYTFTRSIVEVQ